MDYDTALKHRYACCCGFTGRVSVQEGPFGPHWGKALCYQCESFVTWVGKPEAAKTRRTAGHRALVKKYGRGFCELCLIEESQLQPKEFFTAHHVIEYQDTQDSSRDNIWILCNACHSLVHWRRTYQRKLAVEAVECPSS